DRLCQAERLVLDARAPVRDGPDAQRFRGLIADAPHRTGPANGAPRGKARNAAAAPAVRMRRPVRPTSRSCRSEAPARGIEQEGPPISDVLHLDDLVRLGPAGGHDLDDVALLLADQRARDRGGDGDLAGLY